MNDTLPPPIDYHWQGSDGVMHSASTVTNGHLIASYWSTRSKIKRHKQERPQYPADLKGEMAIAVAEQEFEDAYEAWEALYDGMIEAKNLFLDHIEYRGLSRDSVICGYCDQEAEYVDDSEVYQKHYGYIYLCRPCEAWVGVHEGTRKAKGTLANKELRQWRRKAHTAFDPMWNGDAAPMSRSEAYQWLTKALGMKRQAHIGSMDIEQCRQVIEACKELWKNGYQY